MNIYSKFDVNTRAYFNNNATATIYPVVVKYIYLKNNLVFYDVQRIDTGHILSDISEDTLYTFTEAKTNLLEYLQDKITEITNLVAT